MKEDKIYQLIKDRFSLEVVTDDMVLSRDLGADSIELVEIAMDLEEEFNIEIEDEDLTKFVTVGDVVAYFKER